MKKFRADLHIHTVLSPCADLEMSPDRIVQLAVQRGLDIIAITDHNCTRQCAMVKEHARGTDLLVVNGCEVNSREEVHVLCLFEDDYTRDEFQIFLDKYLPKTPNRPDYDGHQVLVNRQNRITKNLPWYLGNPLDIDLETIEKYTHQLNGLFIPAHIDRPINSIFSQIGFLPDELKVDGMQISKHVNENDVRNKYDIHQDISLIKASDSHYIDDLGSSHTAFYLYEPTFQELKWALNQQNGRFVKIEA
jgi:hypothetical protein